MNLREGTRRLALLIGVICASGIVTVAQARQKTRDAKVSLDLGAVTVWLGMPQAEALAQLQGAGYQVIGTGAVRSVKASPNYYNIGFKDQRVVYASRSWLEPGGNAMGAALAALEKISSSGGTSCSVIHEPTSSPGGSTDRISIYCGERSVSFSETNYKSSYVNLTTDDVREGIGYPP